MPGARADHPHRQPVFRVGAAIEVLHEQLAALEIGQHPLVQAGELRRRDLLVDAAPINRVVGARLVDDVLVARAAAGVTAGIDDKRAAIAELALAAPDRMLVKKRHRQVPVHRAQMVHSLFGEAKAGFSCRNRVIGLIQGFLLMPPGAPPQRTSPRLSGALNCTINRRDSTGKPGELRRNRGGATKRPDRPAAIFAALMRGPARQGRQEPSAPRPLSRPARRNRAAPSHRAGRRSMPSGSMPAIRQPSPPRPSSRLA